MGSYYIRNCTHTPLLAHFAQPLSRQQLKQVSKSHGGTPPRIFSKSDELSKLAAFSFRDFNISFILEKLILPTLSLFGIRGNSLEPAICNVLTNSPAILD
jgi:hypothetical protein